MGVATTYKVPFSTPASATVALCFSLDFELLFDTTVPHPHTFQFMLNLTQSFLRLRPSQFRSYPPLRHLISVSLLITLLASCATGPRAPFDIDDLGPGHIGKLEQMVENGLFLDAALAYSKLASASEQPLKSQYSLRAAELLMDGNYVPQSFQLMSEIDGSSLDQSIQIRLSLLAARIAIAREQPEEALAKLRFVRPLLSDETINLQITAHVLRANIYVLQNQPLEAARERTKIDPLLTDPEAIQANQEAIISTLQSLSAETLRTNRTGVAPEVFNGWLELTNIGKSLSASRDSADLTNWRKRYPNHPALDSIISLVVSARPLALTTPTQIALILPLNNRFAKAASAIRDGFLAAYYALPANTEGPSVVVPSVRIYDEGESPENIDFAYTQAVSDGAEFVIGPLNKGAVNQLANRDELPVPVLALNFSEQQNSEQPERLPANFFQMSLSPEQEASQVAEHAWLDGHSRAAIITPATDWGTRVAKAFTERWLQLDGRVVEKQTYDAKKSDYSLPIRLLLNVDGSENRKRDLRRTLGQKVEFIPRRRQDIDFIFMAASSRQARLIKPQLRFHHAPNIPVYATSHSYGGTENKDMDRDMDGVLFSDMPWTLTSNDADNNLKSTLRKNWPEQIKRYTRLYALGIDAYHIISQLNTLRRNRANYFEGKTGDLSLDANNRLQRRLIWARFERGIPKVLNEF
jgi:outer membrane PBP1 activator LpoA protein